MLGFLKRLFGSAPPALPPSRPAPAPLDPPVDPSAPAYSRIGIVYRDADGEASRRIVSVGEVQLDSQGRPAFIVGFCHLRHEVRTFRADRIESAFDPETGEFLSAVTLVGDPAAMSQGYRSPLPLLDQQPGPTIDDMAIVYASALKQQGWLARVESSEEGQRLSCYRANKRTGAPLKYPAFAIEHAPRVVHWIGEGADRRAEFGGQRRKAWRIVHGGAPGALSHFDSAVQAFAKEAGISVAPAPPSAHDSAR
jgi:hypothetical protein